MKRILVSMLTIAIVAVVGFGVTRAFFSDTETSTGNTITAGSIDISVDDENPWIASQKDEIADMKPSYVRWTRHEVKNVGTNPAKLWKHIKDVSTDNNGWSEPECSDVNGTWTFPDACVNFEPQKEKNNIDEFIEYDMYVDGVVSGESVNNWFGGTHTGGTMIISEADGITVADIESLFVYLGEVAPGESIIVWQSYHMKDETGNWAQTDKLTYTIEFYAEQVNGNGPPANTLLLENKVEGPWTTILGDGMWGILKWDGSGSFDFNGHGLTASTNYSLIYYPEPQTTWPHPVTVIDSGIAAVDETLSLSTGTLPGPHSGIKIWLVESSDISGASMSGWNSSKYLFESNLIDTP